MKQIKHLEKVIHYMNVLQDGYSFFQPEMREAIDNALVQLRNDKLLVEQLSKSNFIAEVKEE